MTRVVHHHDKCSVNRTTNHFFIEALRGVGLCFGNGLSLLVLESIFELLHRLAERQRKHLIDFSEHFCLTSFNGSRFLTTVHHITQFKTELTQFRRNQRTHF